jgi:hypothetical protein
MRTTLTTQEYQKLLKEDIEWLLKQPRSLERDHIHNLLSEKIVQEKEILLSAIVTEIGNIGK